jgi:hypothetical protein
MAATPHSPETTLGRFEGPAGTVFQAALETVRELPGWEVLTAHPETGEIVARSRGRIFTPTREHILHLEGGADGTEVRLASRHARTRAAEPDPRVGELLRALLADRLRGAPS